jgi:hypothetical protein
MLSDKFLKNLICNKKIFCDFEKAYYSEPRKLLWQALGEGNVNQSVTQIIRNIYSYNRYIIIIESNLSDEYCNTKGLLQGCPMSPALFRIYICRYSIGRKV